MEDFAEERYVSEVTRNVLKELIERKQELNRCRKHTLRGSVCMLTGVASLFLYALATKGSLLSDFSFASLQQMFRDPLIWGLTLFVLAAYLYLRAVSIKAKEADDEYEELREEIIERLEELFGEPDAWKHRHLVFRRLEQGHDINLYHTH
ncbi:MAG TPA: DUF2663 family protein [Bacillales bacterium]|nr:DUF2663 family protein [Bacillales bacterium]